MTIRLSLIILLSSMHFAKSSQCPTSFNGRCGKNWADANTKCGQCCNSPSDCTQDNDIMCYAYLDTTPCINTPQSTSSTTTSTSTTSTSTTSTSSTSSSTSTTISACPTNIRCGLNWVNANQKCGQCCVSDADCTITNEKCYADLINTECPINTIPTTPSSTSSTTTSTSSTTISACPTNIRCGLNWVDANQKCGECCVGDSDCTITNEQCYADLINTECPTVSIPSTTAIPTVITPSPSTKTPTTPTTQIPLSAVSGCGTGKRVSLTFDDGPMAENDATINIINKLNKYGIKATFYVSPGLSGESAVTLAAKCALIAQLSAAGYEIQSHSYSHKDFLALSNEEIRIELNKVSDFIYDCGAARPTMFRPPYGSLTKQQAQFIVSEGYIIGLWNMDSNDWKTPNELTILDNIDLSVFKGDSVNILMHDKSIYNIIDDIIEKFDDYGYEFITQSECFAQCDTMNEPGYEGICWDKHEQNLWSVTQW
eukprot:797409_1